MREQVRLQSALTWTNSICIKTCSGRENSPVSCRVAGEQLSCWHRAEGSALEQSGAGGGRGGTHRVVEELELRHKTKPQLSSSRCSGRGITLERFLCLNKFDNRKGVPSGAFRLNFDPTLSSPSPSPQRATCALHNSLSQNETHILAACRRMACLSRSEHSAMTPWKQSLVADLVASTWTPSPQWQIEDWLCCSFTSLWVKSQRWSSADSVPF